MSKCSTDPIELILATTDPDLYDETQNKWTWGGTMYWAVECLTSGQSTVSDRVVPAINYGSYTPLTKSPSTWNYCLSKQCEKNSMSMHIVFTFDPKSTDPNDYLQFVVNVHCQVTDYPRHGIKDKNGQDLYLSIVELSKMVSEPYVEIWIAKTDRVTPMDEEQVALTAPLSAGNGGNNWLWVAMIIIIIILIFLIAGGGWWLWQNQKEKPRFENIG